MLDAISMGMLGSDENLRNIPCGLGGRLLDNCSGWLDGNIDHAPSLPATDNLQGQQCEECEVWEECGRRLDSL